MSPESTLRQAIAERMIGIPAGEIVLRDEGTKTNWKVEVGAFGLAPYPVTRELYRAVRGEAPASSAGPRTPVTEVSWKQAVRFCNLLSHATGLQPCYSMGEDPDGHDVVCDWEAGGYRIPSEAEWEYACRAGTCGVRYGELDEIAWYRGNSGGEVHDVATKAPNAWGLYDMIGNVWEWCSDWLGEYPKSAVKDPTGPANGDHRVLRGGSWHFFPSNCRSAFRNRLRPANRNYVTGFRVAAGT